MKNKGRVFIQNWESAIRVAAQELSVQWLAKINDKNVVDTNKGAALSQVSGVDQGVALGRGAASGRGAAFDKGAAFFCYQIG